MPVLGVGRWAGREAVGVMRNVAGRGKKAMAGKHGGGAVSVGRGGRGNAAAGVPAGVRRVADELAAEFVSAVRRETGGAGRAGGAGTSGGSAGPFAGRGWYDFALEYADMRWRQVSAKTRSDVAETLCALTLAMVTKRLLMPDEELLRRALRCRAFVVPRPEGREVPGDERMALRWVAGATRPVGDLLDPEVMRQVIASLSVHPDGSAVPVDTQRHRKAVLVNVVEYAFGAEDLVPEILWRVPRAEGRVDPRVVINPGQARALLEALSYVGLYGRARGRRLVGFFAGMYYAGLRPEEAVAVKVPGLRVAVGGVGPVGAARDPSAGGQEVHRQRRQP